MNDDEVLEEVSNILNDGWCKGAFHKDSRGAITNGFSANRAGSCILGAISLAAEDKEQNIRVQKRVYRGIAMFKGLNAENLGVVSIPGFNDAEETTIEDVQLVLKYARSSE